MLYQSIKKSKLYVVPFISNLQKINDVRLDSVMKRAFTTFTVLS